MSDMVIDIDRLRGWIGSQVIASDIIDTALVERFAATLDLDPDDFRDEAPPGIHWCLSPHFGPTAQVGPDGHPERGGFLPPVPFPRRMWAGGSLEVLGRFRVGDTVLRKSRVTDVAHKVGRTGALVFVTVEHDFLAGATTILKERQDIVYRELTGPHASSAASPDVAQRNWQFRRDYLATAPLLFRYSAITFNSHRIHYDRTYCIEEENYPGLVVHGPLQASYLLLLAIERKGWPKRFSFRGQSPLFDGRLAALGTISGENGDFWITNADGIPTMTAEAEWE